MAITIITAPPLVALTGNPVRFRLGTDNQYEAAGAKYETDILFTDTGAADNSFSLSWSDIALTFVCKASPDQSGLQIPDLTVIANLNDWVAAVAACLAANYYIDRDFVVTVAAGLIKLTAREYGSAYIITGDSTWTNGMEPSIGPDGGSEQIARPFFKIGCQLVLNVAGTWTKCGEDLLPVDASGQATFDVHRLFADLVFSGFQWPESSVNILQAHASHCMEYRIRYFEQYGTTIIPGKITESGSYHILAAGISYLQQAIYNRMSQTTPTSYWTKLSYNQYFLTWQPKTKLIDRYQVEKLHYLVRASYTQLNLKIEINYNDDTAQSTIIKKTVANPVQYGVYEVICTLNRLQLAGYDTGIIDNYRVWLEDQAANRISEIRTFRMDYSHHEEVRQFLFKNSLGGYDTLRVTGDVEDSIELDRATISKVLGADFTELDHQVGQLSVSEVKSYKANTGWLTRDQVAWIRDFFLSTQVYQVIAHKLVPVLISTTQATQRRDREDLFAIEFEYRRAFSSEFYSKEIVTADFSDDFDDDFANE